MGREVSRRRPAPGRCLDPRGTLEGFLKAAEARHKAGVPFGIGLGTTSDSVDTAGALFADRFEGRRAQADAGDARHGAAGDERGLVRLERRSSGARGEPSSLDAVA